MKKKALILSVFIFSNYLLPSSIILKRNIFTAPPPPPKVETQTILKPPPLPPLESLIEIVGIIYFTEGESFVIIKNKRRGDEDIYKTDDIIEKARIVKIEIDKVFFEYDDKNVCLTIEKSSPDASVISVSSSKTYEGGTRFSPRVSTTSLSETTNQLTPTTFNIDFNRVITELESDRSLIEKVNVIPNISDRGIEGFRVLNLPEGSIPYQYGLRNGDIIRSVNGIVIDSIATGFRIYNQIKNSNINTVNVEIIRDGKPINYTFQLNR
ncbi:MAG: hypothetical protein NC915_05245 [Candidatus Omnitrophica bacterium]|nr:hypothetical protein [Candidatus Omnitrophota bacterium]